jgi:hypothetical protein
MSFVDILPTDNSGGFLRKTKQGECITYQGSSRILMENIIGGTAENDCGDGAFASGTNHIEIDL